MSSDILVAFEEYLSINKALDTLTISYYLTDLKQLQDEIKKPLTSIDTTNVLKFLALFPN